MTALDKKFLPLSKSLIGRFGKTITIAHSVFVYDPATGGSVESITSFAIKAIIEDYKGTDFASGLIQQGDKKITIPAVGIEKPKPGYTMTFDSMTFQVVRVTETWSGEQVAVYEIQVRI